MLIALLEVCTLLAAIIAPLFIGVKKKVSAIKFPKNYPDTSEAQYAINDHGYLEEIHHGKVSSHELN